MATAGRYHHVAEYKRDMKLTGYPRWHVPLFRLLMKINRFASTRLKWPTIIHYGKVGGPFWIEYRGGFTDRVLANQAVEQMKAENMAAGIQSQFEVTYDLPLNGVLDGRTDRYVDQDFVGDYIPEFYKANKGPVLCPFKRSLCKPDDVITREEIEPLFVEIAKLDVAVNR